MITYFETFLRVLGPGARKLPRIVGYLLILAILDLVGLGLVAPLIVSVSSPGSIGEDLLPAMLANVADLGVVVVSLLVLIVFSVKLVAGYGIQRRIVRFGETQRSLLMERLMASYLQRPYDDIVRRNTADIVNSIVTVTWQFSSGTLLPLLRLFADSIILVSIVVFLLWVDWAVVLLLTAFLGAVIFGYARVVRQRLAESGKTVTESSARTVQEVNQTISALREIRLLGVEAYCLKHLRFHSDRFSSANAIYGALTSLPKYLMEWTLIVGLTGVLVIVSLSQAATALPLLSLFAVAAIRLMPGVTGLMTGINSLRMNRYGLEQLASELRAVPQNIRITGEPDALKRPIEVLRLQDVSYTYPDASEPAVSHVSFELRRGQALGLIGRSGSGKSTTADLILGMLRPQTGAVLINGVDLRDAPSWMSRMAYIPQQIYLADDSLLRNIAFGVDEKAIDLVKVQAAIAVARLGEVVSKLPDGLATSLGERGARLSGGQRQRVALARALYHDRELIVMDEATAALDHETEREVVASIRSLHGHRTLVIIAHRLSTLEGCDVVVRMDEGRIAEVMGREVFAARLTARV
ncbi:MAG TPA: ABC transporter ATP-binding protein [Verrucomicrobiae bacterium]|nr:ABC transporter ATP-binding protein [Verrucomicrobiae bacterium]